jgi:hypothetical protein
MALTVPQCCLVNPLLADDCGNCLRLARSMRSIDHGLLQLSMVAIIIGVVQLGCRVSETRRSERQAVTLDRGSSEYGIDVSRLKIVKVKK